MTHEYFAAFSRSMYSVQARPWHICTILGCAAQSEMPCHGPERHNRSSHLESLALICSTQAGVPSCSCRLSQNLWWDSLLVLCARSIVGGRYDLNAKKKQKQSTQDDMTAEQSRAELARAACSRAVAYSRTRGFRARANLTGLDSPLH